jgi:peptide/nickel transport system substrate-binding protein
VIVRLRQPSAPFLARSATVGILPEHLLGSIGTAELENAPFNSAPVGSGPYRLESVDSREAKLVANEHYHLGRPGIERMTLRFYPDYAAAQRALTEGDIEGLLIRDQVTEDQVSSLGQVKGIRVEQLQRSSMVLLYVNASNVMFQDGRVRRAFSLALDREELVQRVYPGGATGSSSPVAPGSWAYAETYDDTAPDVAEARRLLEEAGWTANATSGILSRQGSEFRFTIRVDNDPLRVAVAGEVARQLEPLGVRATVASTTFSVLRRDFLQERRYEAAVATWEQGPDPDPYFGWHSSQMGSAGLNLANFEDAVVDGLIAQGRTTTDPEVRLDSYEQLQQVWQELAPGVVIAYPDYVYAYPDWLKNVGSGVLFTGSSRFTDVHLWRR